ncbi:MAG: hypothetical protein CVV50_04970, partial [Spirochaetae bacterium HGW-Spirochaetae-6]
VFRGPEVVKVFLGEHLTSRENPVQIYSLNEEFALARKNRRPSLFFIVLGFMIFLGGLSFALRHVIEKKAQEVSFSIPDFEDLNLAELINTAKNAEERLNRVREELEKSRSQMEAKLKSLEAETEKRIRALSQRKNLSPRERAKRIRELRQGQTQEKGKLQKNYQEQMDSRSKELSELESKLSAYEKQVQDTARRNRISLEKARQDYRVQAAEQRTHYQKELRETEKQLKLLEGKLKDYENRVSQFTDTHRNFKEEVENLRKLSHSKEEDLLLTRSQLSALQGTNSTITSSLEKKSSQLGHYEYAVDFFTRKRKENGYILDPRDPNRMIVAVNKSYAVGNGDKALVYDEEDNYVASVEFFNEDGELKARVLEKVNGKELEPFYKILVRLK